MKTPQPIYDAAIRFAPPLLSRVMTFDEVRCVLMQTVARHFSLTVDEVGKIAIDVLTNRVTELECAAADAVKKWIAPLIASGAPKSVLLGAARGASSMHSYANVPYLTDDQVNRIVKREVKDAIGRRRAAGQ